MSFHHGGKALERRQTTPFQGIDPFSEEFRRPGPGPEVPEVIKGFLEDVGLEKPGTHKKELRKGFFGLRLEIGSPGQEDKLLPWQKALEGSSQALELLLPNLIDGLEKMANDVVE